jgi:hypothetical protein
MKKANAKRFEIEYTDRTDHLGNPVSTKKVDLGTRSLLLSELIDYAVLSRDGVVTLRVFEGTVESYFETYRYDREQGTVRIICTAR